PGTEASGPELHPPGADSATAMLSPLSFSKSPSEAAREVRSGMLDSSLYIHVETSRYTAHASTSPPRPGVRMAECGVMVYDMQSAYITCSGRSTVWQIALTYSTFSTPHGPCVG